MTVLDQLDKLKRQYGADAKPLERLLQQVARAPFSDVESLVRFHESVLFLRAYPHSEAVARLTDELLAGFAGRVAAVKDDESALEQPEVSGIAGSSISAVFSYEAARSLAARHGGSIDLDWDRYEDPARMGPVLAAIAPMAAEEWPVEAHPPVREWVDRFRKKRETALKWLLKRIQALDLTDRQRGELFDRMGLPLTWNFNDSSAARTHTRLPSRALFVHDGPLIPRSAVSIEAEFASPPLAVERVSPADARRVLGLIVDTSAVRYRELYGFNHPDLRRVCRAEAGRGVEVVFFGIPAEWRLPLRAYHAGMFFKNGVPAGYVEVLSFFERAEVGFNLYYTFREGETAWIYARILRLCRQLLGVTHFYLDPYQIGHENEEAIAAGAFWFYRKLGFRSVDPAVRRLTATEESRIAAERGYRTPARTLRRLSSRPMMYEPSGAASGEWDRFHIRKLALARWPRAAKEAFDTLHPAKYGADEARYLRLMQRNTPLRTQLLRLGSA